MGKKAVLFVMVDDTRNCDEVGAHLERIAPELAGAVLVIHTKNNGEISEAASGKNKDELERLRKQSNEIDTWLTAADGAIGNHAYAVAEARKDFRALAITILSRLGQVESMH